jgi:hypothetical protein
MKPIDRKRTHVELLRVSAAKAEMQLRIEERLEEISRLEDQIKIQEAKEQELSLKLNDSDSQDAK